VGSDGQKNIQKLLALAEEDIKALRLMSPKDNNAFDKYLAVLKIDENNEQAKQGIQLISDKYISLAYRAMQENKLGQAKKYLRKARTIQPDSEKLLMAQQTLEDLQTETIAESEEKSSGGLWGDMKDWVKETTEKDEVANKEKTSSDKVIKSLGGN